jgi:23S rRNA pseudouridine2605 synthase
MQERIQKVIANAGLMSRRRAEELIKAGRVFVNGKRETIGNKADPEKDKIVVDGILLQGNPQTAKKAYYALHKPKFVVVTKVDSEGRKTIYDLPSVQKIPEKVLPAGRLDLMTEGLLILSDDGEFINKLTHPSFNIEKLYYIRLEPAFKEDDIETLGQGIMIDGRRTPKSAVRKIRQNEIVITIHEGRNRIVRKMMESLGYKIYALRRIRIGKINLGNLGLGETRPLTDDEIGYVLHRTQ